MPEENNRILTGQVSDMLFCPTQTAVRNLMQEGFSHKPVEVLNVGDVMQDSALFFAQYAVAPCVFGAGKPTNTRVSFQDKPSDIEYSISISEVFSQHFILATLHRAENTDDPLRLTRIIDTLNTAHVTIAPVVLPLHPRTRAAIAKAGLNLQVHVIDPVGYFEMIWLLHRCGLVLTDSGGVQYEASFFGKACVTMRDQTEWVELIDVGLMSWSERRKPRFLLRRTITLVGKWKISTNSTAVVRLHYVSFQKLLITTVNSVLA